MPDTLPTHPRTGLRALGYRRDGRPIWPIMGGDGTGGAPAGAAVAGGGTGEGGGATGEGGQGGEGGAGTGAPAGAPGPDPAAAQALADAQQQATEATARADQMQAALDAINQALNPNGSEGAQDPAALAAAVADRDTQLADLGAQLRTAQVELAAYRAAGEQGARADRLLNSRQFIAAVAPLDPVAADFGDKLAAAIKAAVEGDPELYGTTPPRPTRAGTEFRGAPAGEQRPTTLHDAIAARLGG